MRVSRHTAAKLAVLAALAGGALSGCRKAEEFPEEPIIEFKSFETFGDSASLTVSFTDGDGDIGLDDADNQPPFDSGSTYYFNLFVEYFELRNGTWEHVEFDEIQLYYRIPRITPTGQNKVLEGDLSVAIDPLSLFVTPDADTIRYSVHIVDRALHVSNTVQTSDIILD